MGKTRLLVIDPNKSLVNQMIEYFQYKDIEIVFKAEDGNEGITLIQENRKEIDMILLELILPKKDGLEVLEYMMNNNIPIKVIVISSYCTEEIIYQVSTLGVSFFLIKPFEWEELEKRIKKIREQKENRYIPIGERNLQESITKTLHELGVPSNLKGYYYIREGILLMIDHKYMKKITKLLYPEIAKKYQSTVSRVERSIRHAIDISWNRGNWDLMEEIFGNSVDMEKAKPTNSLFMITIAERIRQIIPQIRP